MHIWLHTRQLPNTFHCNSDLHFSIHLQDCHISKQLQLSYVLSIMHLFLGSLCVMFVVNMTHMYHSHILLLCQPRATELVPHALSNMC